jgi:glycyl-tRNA synthetase beta chain
MGELLLELLSEEIPARMQARAADDLRRLVTDGLAAAGLAFSEAQAMVTPRRIALAVDGLPATQPDVSEERRGPRADAADAAIDGFVKATGVARDRLERRETAKGTFLFATVVKSGRPTAEVLVDVVESAIAQLPWPKSMRWGTFAVRWVRPLQSILCLFDRAVVPVKLGPVTAGDTTRGHRFLAPEAFAVTGFADYRGRLADARVILDRDERRRIIRTEAEALAADWGFTVRDDPALLEEVTGLVEWPVVRVGRIDEAFMAVPPEVLITAMRTHQKYFSLVDGDGRLAPHFVVVANAETTDGGAAMVAGNERVLRARLSDARFFWDQDRKKRLDERVEALAARVFHARLGSDRARVDRLVHLVDALVVHTGADHHQARRAALLCKSDLTTGMVGEFPELQGVMGRYYAGHDHETADVAQAIGEHYAPQGPHDRIPTAPVSVTVALADKIDTLVGFFGIGERPTGSGDPFALRRAALGVIRIIVENGLRVPLRSVLEAALDGYGLQALSSEPGSTLRLPHIETVVGDLLDFFADRLKVHLREQGVRHDHIGAVFALGGEDDLVRLLARVDALRSFLNTEDGANLLTAFKRASNIVRIEEARDGIGYGGRVLVDQLVLQEEQDLHAALERAQGTLVRVLPEERFGEAMATLAALRSPVDAFFDRVTVNCEDALLRANRLRLLSQIRSALGEVADFTQIEG